MNTTPFTELQKRSHQRLTELKSKHPVLYVGTASCGKAAGVDKVIAAIKKYLESENQSVDIVEVGCLGMCCYEPMLYIQAHGNPPAIYGNVSEREVPVLLKEVLQNKKYVHRNLLGTLGSEIEGIPNITEHPMLKPQTRIVLRNCGIIAPNLIEHYVANEGYRGLQKALGLEPEAVIEEIKKSGIRGRGGAGFPTGLKWSFCRNNQADKKYMICNADEGDPGAFMNRSLLESDPHAMLEGLTIAGYAIGASVGYIYIRAEYPLAIERLKTAIAQMKQYHLTGTNILGSSFSFEIRIKEGAGAFVCGEETALIASIEGERGMPRPRPPFPAEKGLWGYPTTINNVETLGTIASIIRNGSAWYSGYGSEAAKGTKTFALVGKIKRTGLIEVPLGTSIRQIVYDIGGGILEDKAFKAIQTGGPSGGCIPADMIELGVDYEALTRAGSIMGSGGLVVMDKNTCMVDVAHYFLSFTGYESCGKCPPCRIGTKLMKDILTKIRSGQGEMKDLEVLEELSGTITNGSLCGLGQSAPNPVRTTLRYFRNEYEAHIKEKKCAALVCHDLIKYVILPDNCDGCGACKKICPAGAISGEKKDRHLIREETCVKCGACYQVCPASKSAIRLTNLY
ncbi:NADH-quinone oxidoreductase subunit NuoF [Deltaproteobacteria bacterium TL4]